MSFQLCILCKEDNGEEVNKVGKGLSSLKEMSVIRERSDVYNDILQVEQSGLAVLVHNSCRRKFTDKWSFNKEMSSSSSVSQKRLRSSSGHFDWKNTCFLCTKTISLRNRNRTGIHEVHTITARDSFLQMA